MQKFANALGTKMYMTGQKGMNEKTNGNKLSTSDTLINIGSNSFRNSFKKVIPRLSYNSSYYQRKNNIF